ncbi:MAG TPA: serine/threonine-protein kinase [Pseudomonadota bacterium]|nr:serine/threonine-protein kinase [Pseudomonadota bacterium]
MATLEENTQVGPYRVIRKLGQGGMGSVYEALHQSLGRHVAIKVLHPEIARNEEFARRFANEARASNIVDHPDVVQITDHGTLPDGIPYIVMEFLKGESLGHRIEHLGAPMNPSEVAFIALQIANVLSAAHIKGIIHRDLKPENVMLMGDSATATGERVKVLDFGIAKLIEEQNEGGVQTRATELLGTPNYMSPEQCRGAKGVDEKTDVYALGVMMFEMLVGRPPFSGSALGELMAKHMYEPAPKVAAVNPHVPEKIAHLVDVLLDKDKEKRPTMAVLEVQLEQLTTELPAPQKHRHRNSGAMAVVPSDRTAEPDAKTVAGVTPTPNAITGVVEKAKRSKTWIAMVGAFLLVAGGAGAFWGLRKPSPPKPAEVETPKRIRWQLRSLPAGAKVVRMSDKVMLGQTPLEQEALKTDEPLHLRLELEGYIPHEVQVGRQASGEVQIVLKPDAKRGAKPDGKPDEKDDSSVQDGKSVTPTKKKPKRPKSNEPHIEN